MQPTYKRIKTFAPFCPKCGEQLSGNNSIASPWRCTCGRWECKGYDLGFDYKIIKEKTNGRE